MSSATNEARQWYTAIPPVTKTLVTLSVVLVVTPALGLLDPSYLILYWPDIYKLQLWRLFTVFFVNRISLSFAMNLFFLYRYSHHLETEVFSGRTADYVYFHMVVGLMQLVAAYVKELYVLSDGLLLAVTYLWSQYNQETLMSFMFGIQFKAVYLPWVLLGYDMLSTGALPWSSLMGLGASYAYYYLTNVWPSQGGARWLQTPQWVQRAFPTTHRRAGGFASGSSGGVYTSAQAQAQTQSSTFGHSWGRGQRLGS